MAFTKRAAEIWRDFTDALNPLTGVWQPAKAEIRAWGLEIENQLGQLLGDSGDSLFTRVTTLEGWRQPLAGRAFVHADTDPKGGASASLPRGHTALSGARLPGRVTSVLSDPDGFAHQAFARGEFPVSGRRFPGSRYAYVRTDPEGFASRVQRADDGGFDDFRRPPFGTKLVHILNYGQSLSLGWYSSPILTTAALANCYSFSGGNRADDAGGTYAANRASLIPFKESAGPSPNYETPMGGALQCVMQLAAAYGATFGDRGQFLLGSSAGAANQTVAQLSPGVVNYERARNDIFYGVARAAENGWSYSLPAIIWEQGEADIDAGTSPKIYVTQREALRAYTENYYWSVAGRSNPVHMVSYQVSTHNFYGKAPDIALAQLDQAMRHPLHILTTPTYFLPYSDTVHLTNVGSKTLGAYQGKALAALDRGEKFLPLYPTSVRRLGRVVFVKFHVPVPPLVFDITTITDPNGAKGFELWELDTSIPISSVSIVGGDTVVIKAGADLSDIVEVRYADAAPAGYVPGTTSPNAGSRGNLHDSDPFVFDPSGVNARLWNWCVIFRKGLD
ncbi:hypothetical protein [Methylobacterium gnaphalii]|uniref:Sialate O-acetylesterase domain-containing protein n=1 Tax=Methylobacterium gnaphalii TaxID=1010610 RepID=A0A512JQL6_9HYPH|nr:hypothetical protein [Methylobacterium gnaphalii]GEP12248.1 hypothetical protein MGN01_40930 [Methylobacterium gnaphalii]GJD68748.1 hypothetical protein MMMDOFMJ_1672 [Methylobacterium gnaphalii]GLS49355.1 hypothetical protein GCM10007885_22030 [Methylobacterium gnaphalii]